MNILHIHPRVTLWAIELSVSQQSGKTGERQVITLMHSDPDDPNPIDLRYRVALNSPLYYSDDALLAARIGNICGWPDIVHVHTDAKDAETIAVVRAVMDQTSIVCPLVWDFIAVQADGDPSATIAAQAHHVDGVTSPTMDIDGLSVPFLRVQWFDILKDGNIEVAIAPLTELDGFYMELMNKGLEI